MEGKGEWGDEQPATCQYQRGTTIQGSSAAEDCGCKGEIELRMTADGRPFVTDNGNYILDCAFGRIEEPEELDDALKFIPGVVDNGLFLEICDVAIIAGDDGVRVQEADREEFDEDD